MTGHKSIGTEIEKYTLVTTDDVLSKFFKYKT